MTKDLIFSFGLKSSFAAIGLVTTVLLTRNFAKADTGMVFFAMSTIAVLSSFGRVGLETVVARRSSTGTALRHAHTNLVVYAFALVVAASCVSFLILMLSRSVSGEGTEGILRTSHYAAILAAALLEAGFLVLIRTYQGIGRPQLFLSLALSQKIALLIGVGVLATLSFTSVGWFLTAYLLSTAIPFILVWLHHPATFLAGRSMARHIVRIRSLFREGVPIAIAGTVSVFAQHAGVFAIGVLASTRDVATYGVLFRIASVVGFLVVAASTVLAPQFARSSREGGLAAALAVYARSCRTLALLCIPVVLAVILTGKRVLTLFGAEYSADDRLLLIMMAGQLVNVVTGSLATLFIMTRNARPYRNISVASSCISVLLTWFLTERYGITGTAVAYTSSLTLLNLSLLTCILWMARRDERRARTV